MAKPEREKKDQPAASAERRVLPMELQVGKGVLSPEQAEANLSRLAQWRDDYL